MVVRAALSCLLLLLLPLFYFLHARIQAVIHPPLSLSRPVHSPRWGNSSFLCDHRTSTVTGQPYCLHVLSLPASSPTPHCHLLLVHGTAAHAAQYHSVARIPVETTGCSLYGLDMMGHGRSGGDRGSFTLHDFILDIEAAALHIRRRESLTLPAHLRGKKSTLVRRAPIILLGSSQGGEVAYRALHSLPQSLVSGAVSLNLWLSPRYAPSLVLSLLTHPWVLPVVRCLLHHVRVPLPLLLPFPELYSTERMDGRLLFEEKLRDPLTQWAYSFPSYLSLFLPVPVPPRPYHGLVRKRLLVVCGELDPVVSWRVCERAVRVLRDEGGEVELYVWPRGVHQLLLLEGEAFGALIGSWIEQASEDIRREWLGAKRHNGTRRWEPPASFPRSVHLPGDDRTTTLWRSVEL